MSNVINMGYQLVEIKFWKLDETKNYCRFWMNFACEHSVARNPFYIDYLDVVRHALSRKEEWLTFKITREPLAFSVRLLFPTW